MSVTTNQSIGALGEKIAAAYLQRHGYAILTTNYKTSYKELDIVAQRGDVLVFVEVKTRTSLAYGDGTEAMSPRKQRDFRAGINRYLRENRWRAADLRADLITVMLDRVQKTARVRQYKGVL
jgi:putative endonuclease